VQLEDCLGLRETHITRSAFSILYACQGDTIFIIDIRDSRDLRTAESLRKFSQELRGKYKLGVSKS
jgi:hypothetical protein